VKLWITSIGSNLGSGLIATCCVGGPAVVGILSAMGLGFLVHDAILIPVLVLFLGTNLWVAQVSGLKHERKSIFWLTAVSALIVFSGLWFSRWVVGAGIGGLVVASAMNLYCSSGSGSRCSPVLSENQKKGR
jgi:mercuric ion transport protein